MQQSTSGQPHLQQYLGSSLVFHQESHSIVNGGSNGVLCVSCSPVNEAKSRVHGPACTISTPWSTQLMMMTTLGVKVRQESKDVLNTHTHTFIHVSNIDVDNHTRNTQKHMTRLTCANLPRTQRRRQVPLKGGVRSTEKHHLSGHHHHHRHQVSFRSTVTPPLSPATCIQ